MCGSVIFVCVLCVSMFCGFVCVNIFCVCVVYVLCVGMCVGMCVYMCAFAHSVFLMFFFHRVCGECPT